MSAPSVLDLENDNGMRRLCYLAAFLIAFAPFLQTMATLLPLGLGNVQWRFQAANVLSGVLLFVFVGLVLVAGIARASYQKGMNRLVGWLSVAITALLLLSAVLFVLDALQLRAIVKAAAMAQFQSIILRVGLVMVVFAVAFILLALVALRGPAAPAKAPARGPRKTTPEEPVGLLIGQNYTKSE